MKNAQLSLLVAAGVSALSFVAAPAAFADLVVESKHTVAQQTNVIAEKTPEAPVLPTGAMTDDQPADDVQTADKKPTGSKVPTTITWQTSLSRTLATARTEKKWVLVDVFTDWCHWCKRLDSDVYANAKIAQFINKSFVCLKANAEKPGDGVAIKDKYGIDGYPCTLVLEPSGKEKGRINGYLSPGEFPLELTRILQQGR